MRKDESCTSTEHAPLISHSATMVSVEAPRQDLYRQQYLSKSHVDLDSRHKSPERFTQYQSAEPLIVSHARAELTAAASEQASIQNQSKSNLYKRSKESKTIDDFHRRSQKAAERSAKSKRLKQPSQKNHEASSDAVTFQLHNSSGNNHIRKQFFLPDAVAPGFANESGIMKSGQ